MRFFFPTALALVCALVPWVAPGAEQGGTFSLARSLALALARNPELAATSWDIRVADARIIQAGLRPNPAAGVQVENFAGGKEFRGFQETETTLELSQLVELGGKRAARLSEAQLGRELARFDYEAKRLDVLMATAQAFIEVLGAQRRVALSEEVVLLAEQFVPLMKKRVEAGKASAVEEARNDVAVASARIGLEQAKRDLAAARRRLATNWGARQPDFGSVAGDLERIAEPPGFGGLLSGLQGNPTLARWQAETNKRRATLAKEKANVLPDVTVSGGPRWLNGPNSAALVAGVSIPLPLWNRNQGAIREAEGMIGKAGDERRAAEITLVAALGDAYERLAKTYAEVQILNKSVLPSAQKAVAAVKEGYEIGKLSQLEVLDARRTLTEARTQHLQALIDYHKAAAELETLTGARLRTLKK